MNPGSGLITKLGKIIIFLLALEIVFFIHEYGHFSEFKKRNIPIEEFSLGIGPIIYQTKINKVKFSFRLIPLAAYVMPTSEGYEIIKEQTSSWDKIIIYSAGVRNNLISAIIMVWLLQLVALKRKIISSGKLIKELIYLPVNLVMKFLDCFLAVFIQRLKIKDRFILSTGGFNPPKIIKKIIFLSFILGFLNILPIHPLDGGRIFTDLISKFLSEPVMFTIQITSFWLLIFIFFFRGIRKHKFVDYRTMI